MMKESIDRCKAGFEGEEGATVGVGGSILLTAAPDKQPQRRRQGQRGRSHQIYLPVNVRGLMKKV